MSEKSDGVRNKDVAWDSMIRLSAAILNRDFGSLSRQEALRRSDEYGLENNGRARLFWIDVAATIANNDRSHMQ